MPQVNCCTAGEEEAKLAYNFEVWLRTLSNLPVKTLFATLSYEWETNANK